MLSLFFYLGGFVMIKIETIQTYTYKDLDEVKELHKKLYEAMAMIDDYNVFANDSFRELEDLKSFAVSCLLGIKQYIRNNCFLCDYATSITKERRSDMSNVCKNCPAFKNECNSNGIFYCETGYKPYVKLIKIFRKRIERGPFSEEETKEIRELCLEISKLFVNEEE